MLSLITSFFLFSTFYLPLSCSSSAISLNLSPKTLTKSGDTVGIQWSGIESPSELDWLGIYNPPNSSNDDFIGYVFLSTCQTYKSGSCSIDLPLTNLRSNYEFRIFHWSEDEIKRSKLDHDHNPLPGTKHLLARSEELGFVSLHGPEQVHLAFTEYEDEMRVMFVTGDGLDSYVNYGVDEDRMVESEKTVVRRFEQSDMCDSPANESVGWRDQGFIHDGVMRNLQNGKKYYYRVGSDARGWSATYSFMSRDRDSDETIAFLFGDMGAYAPYSTFRRTQDESKLTVKWILRDIEALGDKPAFVSHIGDISYARGYLWLWDEFFSQIEPIASKVPYHVCIGNHEYDWPLQPWKPSWAMGVYNKDGGGECGVPYSLKFNMPGNSSLPTGTGAPDTQNLYYSFDEGVVHFLYISTETNFLRGSDQYNFIERDLGMVDREKTPFVVVQGHRPMYTTSDEVRDAAMREKLLDHLEPLLVTYKVTLALWGHVHRYERFCPMKNYSCGVLDSGSDLPVHAVIGMAGQDWQPTWEPRPNHRDFPIFPQPERSMYRGGEFGYTRLVATREKLTLTYIGNHDGQAHDMVEILSVRDVNGSSGHRVVVGESKWYWYVKEGSVLVLGAFLGYVIGFISRSKKDTGSGRNWTPVKSEEV